MLSRTISKLLQIIYQICAFNRGVLFFNTLVRVNPETYDHEIWPQETRNIVVSCCANCVSISWTGGVAYTSLTDRQTDGHCRQNRLTAMVQSNDHPLPSPRAALPSVTLAWISMHVTSRWTWRQMPQRSYEICAISTCRVGDKSCRVQRRI